MNVQPTYERLQIMRAHLAGYCEQVHAIALAKAIEVVRAATPPGVAVTGTIVMGLLRGLKFKQSHLPADAGSIIYRRTA